MKKNFMARNCWRGWSLTLNVMMIFLFVMALGFLWRETNFEYYSRLFSSMPVWLIRIRFIFSISLRLLMLLGAIGVVLRQNMARNMVQLYSVFTILTIYWKHPYSTFEELLFSLAKAGQISESILANISLHALALTLFFCLKDVLIAIIILYLLKRKDIIVQFYT